MREPPEGRLDTPVFFLDRNLGHEDVAAALRARGACVEEHDRHFPRNAPDHAWLPEVGRRGWAVITQDTRIRYRSAERVAAETAKVALFVFTGKKMRGVEIGAAIAAALPKMVRMLGKQRRPFIARVSRSGEVTIIGHTR